MPDLGWYRNLKELKRFEGKHAKFVGLMENNIVKKAYHTAHREIYEHELYCIKRLQNEKFVPRLLMADTEKRVIYMSYCGKPVKDISKFQPKINKYQRKLQEEYGIHHNDVREGNVCIDAKGQIYLIDFGWSREYEGVGGYGKGKIGNTKTSVPVTKKELLDLLKEMYYAEPLNVPDFKSRIQEIFIRDNDPLPKTKKEDEKKSYHLNNVKELNENKYIEEKLNETTSNDFDSFSNKEENEKLNEIENKEINKNFEIENKEINKNFEIENKNNEIENKNNEIENKNKEIENENLFLEKKITLTNKNKEIENFEKKKETIVVNMDKDRFVMKKNETIEVLDVRAFRIQRQGNPYLWSQI